MDILHEVILRNLYDMAIRTTDMFVLSYELEEKSHKEICKDLEKWGYISKLDFHGHKKVQCKVENKTTQYFRKMEKK